METSVIMKCTRAAVGTIVGSTLSYTPCKMWIHITMKCTQAAVRTIVGSTVSYTPRCEIKDSHK